MWMLELLFHAGGAGVLLIFSRNVRVRRHGRACGIIDPWTPLGCAW
jgi:hypothetical protein